MSTYKSANVDFDALFDPDVIGDGPTAAGYKQGGTPLKYAALKYGTKGPNCGYAQAGVDVSNLWAKKGTANYALPINGQSFVGTQQVVSGSGSASISFSIAGGNGWVINGSTNTGPQQLAAGATPVGAVSVKFTLGAAVATAGGGAGGSTTNAATTPTPLTSNPSVAYSTAAWTAQTQTHETQYPLRIDFYNASGSAISTTNVMLVGHVEGSAS